MPFRPKHGSKLSEDLDLRSGNLSVPMSSGLPNGQEIIAMLEAKVNEA